jgi:uroporphyrinogen-III synthase
MVWHHTPHADRLRYIQLCYADTHSTNTIKRYPLVVLSERIKTFAQSIGFTQVEVATKISDKGLLEALTNLTKT